jgi:hypothetical protein
MAAVAVDSLLAARTPEQDYQLLIVGLYLAGALLLGAAIIALISRWRKRSDLGLPSPTQQLSEFRVLYEKGEISKEEFERLRSLLGGALLAEKKAGQGEQPTSEQVFPASREENPVQGSTPDEPPTGIKPA